MFILNALCCGNEEPERAVSNKSKSIRKILTDESNINSIDSPSPIEINHKKNEQSVTFASPGAITPTFTNQETPVETVKSDECNAGSNVTSLEEEVSDQFVSPINLNKISSNEKENNPPFISNKNLSVCDNIEVDVKEWSVKDVLKFLTKIGMKNYNTQFYKNKVKGKDFISLTDKELKEDLQIQDKDIKILTVYIELLKERAEKEKKERGLQRNFSGKKKRISLYKSYSNTYSTRKILTAVKNPIVEEDSEEDNCDYEKKENMTMRDMFSTTNLSELLTN